MRLVPRRLIAALAVVLPALLLGVTPAGAETAPPSGPAAGGAASGPSASPSLVTFGISPAGPVLPDQVGPTAAVEPVDLDAVGCGQWNFVFGLGDFDEDPTNRVGGQ